MNNSFWFLARILTRCSVEVDQEPLFSEEFVLLRGASYEEAFAKAEAKGKSMAHSYANEAGDNVQWSFQSVLEVQQLLDEEIADGCEVYARTCSVPPEVVPRGPLV